MNTSKVMIVISFSLHVINNASCGSCKSDKSLITGLKCIISVTSDPLLRIILFSKYSGLSYRSYDT